MNNWTEREIAEFFEFTIPGEWGLPPTMENSVPVIRSTNFRNDGKIDFSDIDYRNIEKSRLEKRIIRRGDILIEKSGGSTDQPAGRVVYCDIDFGGTCSNFIELGRVKSTLDSKFVFYLLFHLYQTGLVLKYQQQTTGIINFKLGEYKREEVQTTQSKVEQSCIATVLSCIDCAIEQTEAQITKQQRIKAGLMQDLLTKGIDEHGNIRSETTHEFKDSELGKIPKEWESRKLKDIVSPTRPIVYGILMPGYGYPGGIPVIKVKDIKNGVIATNDLLLTSPVIDNQYKRSKTRAGDLLFTIRGTVGRTAFVPDSLDGANITQDTARVGICEGDPRFVRAYLSMPVPSRFIDIHTLGVAVQGINLGDVRQIPIVFPSPTEQKGIGDIIHHQERLISNEIDFYSKLKKIKAGLMQGLLTGKVSIKNLLPNHVAFNV